MQRTSCQISFGLFDVSARDDSAYIMPGKQGFSDLSVFNRTGEEEAPRVATPERDFFLLDGTFDLFPDDAGELRHLLWSSSMSDGDGLFAANPTLEITFSENHTCGGLTFRFDRAAGDHPSAMAITWYNGSGVIIATGEYAPDAPEWFAHRQAEDFRRIVIEFRGTAKPYRYIKLEGIDFGVEKVFGPESIMEAKVQEEADPISAELSINTLDVTIHSRDADFSLLNPQGAFVLLQQRQRMTVYETVDGIRQYLGTYYLDTWQDAQDNKVALSATDLLGVIDQTRFMGGMYAGNTAAAVLGGIFASANAEYELHESLKDIPVYGHIPICSHREAVQQVAFAIGAVVNCAASDKVRIYPRPLFSSGLVPVSRKFIGGKVQLSELITEVSVTAHGYTPTTEVSDVLDEELPAGEYEIVFSEPLHNVIATGATITEGNVNYTKITVPQGGAVAVAGQKYAHSRILVTRSLTPLPANVTPNTLNVENATLVGSHNAGEVADRVYDNAQKRYSAEFTMVRGAEEVSKIYIIGSLRGEYLRGEMVSMSTDLMGGFLTSVKVVGVRMETTFVDYAGELWAGDGIGVI